MRAKIAAVAALIVLSWTSSAVGQLALIFQNPDGTLGGGFVIAEGKLYWFSSTIVLKPSIPGTPEGTRATYVYNVEDNDVPPGVKIALQKLNAEGKVVATQFEKDLTDGDEQVPDKNKVALEAARKAGLPCLVIERPGMEPTVILAPTEEAQVLEALK